MNYLEAKAEIIALFAETTGIANVRKEHLTDNIDNAIAAQKKFHGIASTEEYLALLKSNKDELNMFCELATVSITWWLRNTVVWDHYGKALSTRLREHQGIIQIWSAGCSKGQEAYAAAIIANEVIALKNKRDYRVLATDYSEKILGDMITGEYRLKDITPKFRDELIQRYFESRTGTKLGIVPSLKEHLWTNIFNLVKDSWEYIPNFDFIFCRNVMFYFSPEDKKRVLDNLVDHLLPKGYLYIGDSDGKYLKHDKLTLVSNTDGMAFQKGE